MSGILPKDPALRQRRNKASTRAVLPAGSGKRRRVPSLPARDHEWHPLTLAWWRDIWRSPMAAEFLKSDTHGLFMLAETVDRFWRAPNTVLLAEIRQQRQCYGLTPLDRRRLEWSIEQAKARKRKPQREAAGTDPRDIFRVLEGGMK